MPVIRTQEPTRKQARNPFIVRAKTITSRAKPRLTSNKDDYK